MRTTFKKNISVLLSLLMMLFVPAVAFAAGDDVILSGSAGETVTWTLTEDGVLTVTGTGPIEDETEVDYYNDGTSCTSTLDSIGMTFARYFDEQVEGLTAVEAEQLRFALVREIVVEEGITEIPFDEFFGMYPTKVTLPSTLERMGYDAFNLLFAEEITVNSVTLYDLPIHVPAYESDAEPYESLSAAKEDYLEKVAAQEAFDFDMIAFDVLYNCACVQMLPEEAYWPEMTNEEKQEMLDLYNRSLGAQETELEALAPIALRKLNELFGTDYTSFEDIFTAQTNDDGDHALVTDPELQDQIDAKNDELYDNSRLTVKSLEGEYDPCIVYGWFTVTAPAGGNIEANCKASGVSFHALEGVTVPTENENACKWCGEDHSGNLWQRFVGFLHSIFYFFAHLFGKM